MYLLDGIVRQRLKMLELLGLQLLEEPDTLRDDGWEISLILGMMISWGKRRIRDNTLAFVATKSKILSAAITFHLTISK